MMLIVSIGVRSHTLNVYFPEMLKRILLRLSSSRWIPIFHKNTNFVFVATFGVISFYGIVKRARDLLSE